MLTRSQAKNKEIEFFKLPYTGRLYSRTRTYNPFSKLYQGSNTDSYFLKCMMEKSIQFQTLVMNEIERRIGIRIPEMCRYSGMKTIEENRKIYKQVLQQHEQPIISRLPVMDSIVEMGGILPLIVRNDYLSVLFSEEVMQRLSTLSLPLHGYTPIFIAFSTIKLQKNEMMVMMENNIRKHMYKLYMSNESIHSDYGILIGRRYTITGKTFDHALERIGVVDFSKICHEEIKKCISPSLQMNDFTLYRCTEKDFDKLRAQEIKSVHDPRCTVEALGFKETDTRVPILREILKTQQGEALMRPEHLVFPSTNKKRYFVDFETIMSVLNDHLDSLTCQRDELIFMIGVGEEVDGEWVFHKLLLEELTLEAERKLLNQFFEMITIEPSILYCWSDAELRFLNGAQKRHAFDFPEIDWMDLYKYFNSTPITIKGCYNFKLKSVAKAMLSHGMISTEYGDLADGVECSAAAYCYYRGHLPERVMQDIIHYNEVDCKVMWEIVQYLRKKE